MAIDFISQPRWRYGGTANNSVEFKSLTRSLYADYSTSNYPLIGASGWGYVLSVHNTSGSSFWGTASNQSGCYPNTWVGPGEFPEDNTMIVMSLEFPAVKRRFEIVQRITHNAPWPDLNYTIAWTTRWMNTETETVDATMTYPGWSANSGFYRNEPESGTPGCNLVFYKYTDARLIGFTTNGWTKFDGGLVQGTALTAFVFDQDAFLEEVVTRYGADFANFEYEEVSPEVGPVSHEDGYRPHDPGYIWQTDTVGLPPIPDISICDLGFVNMYAPQAADLTDLGEEIFPDLEWQTVTGNDVVDAILNAVAMIPDIVKVFINSRLIDYVQDIHVIPFTPVTSGTGPIKLGFRTLNINCPIVTSDYVEADLGEINVEEAYTQFMDYQPYTQAKLYLPFVGFVPVEPEWFQNGRLKVVYRASVRDGSFMCFVMSIPSRVNYAGFQVVGEYAGNACIHAPITGLNYSSMVSGLIGGAAATVGAINAGNPAAATMAALNTAAAAPQVQSSNGFTGQAAFMGGRYPFLMITRTVSHYPAKYQHDKGMPSKITTNLGGARGFVSVKDVDLSGFQATEAEKDEIRKLLADGIYVN